MAWIRTTCVTVTWKGLGLVLRQNILKTTVTVLEQQALQSGYTGHLSQSTSVTRVWIHCRLKLQHWSHFEGQGLVMWIHIKQTEAAGAIGSLCQTEDRALVYVERALQCG